MSTHGHYWTIWPLVRERARKLAPPPFERFTCPLDDPAAPGVEMTGALTRRDPENLVVLVHGLGGSANSVYLCRAAHAAVERGVSVLRLNLRGADRAGGDFYHAGLTADLHRVLAAPALAAFRRLWVFGFSVGGHVVLKSATEVTDPRVRAAAALCSPLDLDATVSDFDRPGIAAIYRRYVFGGIFEQYRAVAARRPPPTPIAEVERARSLRELDNLIVAPRFGFANAEDYYAQMSVGPRLGNLRVPALLVASEHDPMVTSRSIRVGLGKAGSHPLRVAWSALGGHVGFPAGVALGLHPESAHPTSARAKKRRVDEQILDWLLAQ